MKFDIFRSVVYEAPDYFELLKSELDNQSYVKFSPKLETTHGILVESRLPENGLYFIYKKINDKYQLLYVGLTNYKIYIRVARYVAAVRNTQRFDENHAGGEKHRSVFGPDLDDMYLKTINFDFSSLVNVTPEDLEKMLIEKLQPVFNSENYSNYFFNKKIEIIKV